MNQSLNSLLLLYINERLNKDAAISRSLSPAFLGPLPTYITDSYVIVKEGICNYSILSQTFSKRIWCFHQLYIRFLVLLARQFGKIDYIVRSRETSIATILHEALVTESGFLSLWQHSDCYLTDP